jgi:monothiol glutaredoxin
MRLLGGGNRDPVAPRCQLHRVNALEDDAIRQGVEKFSNWPTIPQLYVKQEFVGGCDIVREMYQGGELQKLLQDKGVTVGK